MSSLRFPLEQLNPRMREQAERKYAEQCAVGAVREHKIDATARDTRPDKKGGRPPVSEEIIEQARALDAQQVARTEISRRLGISAHTLRMRLGPKVSVLEAAFHAQLREAGIGGWQTEYRADPVRRWRLDIAWVDLKFYVEVQGMAHRIKERFVNDIERQALLTLSGWQCLLIGGQQIRDGTALKWTRAMLEGLNARR